MENSWAGRHRLREAERHQVGFFREPRRDRERHVQQFSEHLVDEGDQRYIVEADLNGFPVKILTQPVGDPFGDRLLDDDAGVSA